MENSIELKRKSFLCIPNFQIQKRKSFLSVEPIIENNEENIVLDLVQNTPLHVILSDLLNLNPDDYIHHSKTFLMYDEEEAYIFLFTTYVIFTHIFTDETAQSKNPIIYSISMGEVINLFK